VADSLKVLDLKWPIREADICAFYDARAGKRLPRKIIIYHRTRTRQVRRLVQQVLTLLR
jgi:hypothetical protein